MAALHISLKMDMQLHQVSPAMLFNPPPRAVPNTAPQSQTALASVR